MRSVRGGVVRRGAAGVGRVRDGEGGLLLVVRGGRRGRARGGRVRAQARHGRRLALAALPLHEVHVVVHPLDQRHATHHEVVFENVVLDRQLYEAKIDRNVLSCTPYRSNIQTEGSRIDTKITILVVFCRRKCQSIY